MREMDCAGLTLLELLLALAIISLALGAGLPALQGVVDTHRLTASGNTLLSHLHYARGEAIRRGHAVEICPGAFPSACGDGEWSQGWYIGARIDSDTVRRLHGHNPDQPMRLTYNRTRIIFRYDGSSSAGGTFRLCSPGGRYGLRLILSRSGRVRQETAPEGSCPPP